MHVTTLLRESDVRLQLIAHKTSSSCLKINLSGMLNEAFLVFEF